MEKIDFVVTWVDNNDPTWCSLKDHFEATTFRASLTSHSNSNADENADCRYRDFGLIRYWFRSVERFAPWVNKIFFITCGQKPAWLNPNHAKLVFINHEDYIPNCYLPTFNSNTIELNLHRIKELSERFVLFNDDVLLLQPITANFFFRNGNPVLISSLKYPENLGLNNWSRVALNNYCLVNHHHNIKESVWTNKEKWFSFRELGMRRAFRNMLCYLANYSLPVSNYGHIAQPNLKSTIQDIWDHCPEELDRASQYKFRSDDQVNQWLFCAWNQALGKFYPAKGLERGRRIHIAPEYLDWICDIISSQSFPQICLNDTHLNTDPEFCTKRIIPALDALFSNKSSFEID